MIKKILLGLTVVAIASVALAQGVKRTPLQKSEFPDGYNTVSGIAEGLDPDGALRLRLQDGALERITAGDVFFGGS